jgi:hypothetical protein
MAPALTFADLRAQVLKAPLVFTRVAMSLRPLLVETILGLAATRPRFATRNLGGWKSDEAIFDASPSLQALRTTISLEFLAGRKPIGWAMVNHSGSEHPRHQHRMATVSGVYYVTAGDPCVPTIFETEAGEVSFDPIPGNLVLFAGEAWHWVPKYMGTEPRITIAFDVHR